MCIPEGDPGRGQGPTTELLAGPGRKVLVDLGRGSYNDDYPPGLLPSSSTKGHPAMSRFLAVTVLLSITVAAQTADPPTPPEGVLPVGADGRPLNLDFEIGTLKDWTAEGDAFLEQPIEGDTVARRRRDMRSQHQGRFWVGGYERQGDRPQGTLTSVSFPITHPWASF